MRLPPFRDPQHGYSPEGTASSMRDVMKIVEEVSDKLLVGSGIDERACVERAKRNTQNNIDIMVEISDSDADTDTVTDQE